MTMPGEIAVRQRPGPTDDDEDARLWSAAAAGDDTAFDALIQRHYGVVSAVAARFLPDSNDVDDVVQETFVRAHAARLRTPGRDCVRAWLLRIAVNLCKSRLQTPWWRRVVLSEDAVLALAAGTADPAALAEASLLRKEVAEAVQRLPGRLRLPFVLRYFDELSGTEIAAVLGCRESTVWTRIYAARRELRRQLGESVTNLPEAPA